MISGIYRKLFLKRLFSREVEGEIIERKSSTKQYGFFSFLPITLYTLKGKDGKEYNCGLSGDCTEPDKGDLVRVNISRLEIFSREYQTRWKKMKRDFDLLKVAEEGAD